MYMVQFMYNCDGFNRYYKYVYVLILGRLIKGKNAVKISTNLETGM